MKSTSRPSVWIPVLHHAHVISCIICSRSEHLDNICDDSTLISKVTTHLDDNSGILALVNTDCPTGSGVFVCSSFVETFTIPCFRRDGVPDVVASSCLPSGLMAWYGYSWCRLEVCSSTSTVSSLSSTQASPTMRMGRISSKTGKTCPKPYSFSSGTRCAHCRS